MPRRAKPHENGVLLWSALSEAWHPTPRADQVDQLRIDVLDITRWDAWDFPITMRVIVRGEIAEQRVFERPPAA
jgi:hypothetical protein